MTSASQLSPDIVQRIKDARHTQEDYRKAMTEFMTLGKGIPDHTQVERVAKMYAAIREDKVVRDAIGDNINYFAGWVLPEMYCQLAC